MCPLPCCFSPLQEIEVELTMKEKTAAAMTSGLEYALTRDLASVGLVINFNNSIRHLKQGKLWRQSGDDKL